MVIKRGVVCIYYEEHLPLICKPNLTSQHECLICELKIGNKNVLFQSSIDLCINRLRSLKVYITIFFGDFNARNTFWWGGDILNTEGLVFNKLCHHYNLHQLINTPTHILPNSEIMY